MTTLDYPDYGTAQQHADRIALTGAPLIHNNTSLSSGAFVLATVPSSNPIGPLNIGQICYELWLSLENGAPVGNASYIQVQFDWSDQATGLLLARRRYKLVSGPNGSPHTLKIAGPVHGDRLTITVSVLSDSVHGVTVIYQLLGTSRLYARDVVRSTIPTGDGFTLAGAVPDLDVLINTAPSVAAAGQLNRLMPAYNGLVYVGGFTSSGANDFKLAIVEAFTSAPVLANDQVIAVVQSGTNGFINSVVSLPNVQCLAQMTNNNAALQTLNLVVSMQEPTS